jgi:trimeric autotransporter adhesin
MKSRAIVVTTVLSAAACFALLSIAQAAPSPELPAPNATDSPAPGVLNTRDGQSAMPFISTGTANSAFGAFAQFSNVGGNFNTAVGAAALDLNTGDSNTAVGVAALLLNQIASDNNAFGTGALLNNDSDGAGLATFNNAFGRNALTNNVDGDENDAFGDNAIEENTTGSQNTAMGDDALDGNTTGSGNTAVGKEAGNSIIDGNDNVVLGHNAGIGIMHASRNIAIGTEVAGPFTDFDDTCFIGSIFGEIVSDPGSQAAVFVDQFNVVGIFNSSRKYKHDIQPMDKASETLYRLKPVTFKFNSDWKGTTQYGLIAEEVAEVDPQLVVHDKNGEITSVHYEQINSMLLNEFLKEHKKVEEQQASISQLKSEMQTMLAQLKEQAAQIQKVSAQLEVREPAAKVVVNEP